MKKNKKIIIIIVAILLIITIGIIAYLYLFKDKDTNDLKSENTTNNEELKDIEYIYTDDGPAFFLFKSRVVY